MFQTVGIIGTGAMGSAIAALAADDPNVTLLLSNRTEEKARALAATLRAHVSTNTEIAQRCDLIVKGQALCGERPAQSAMLRRVEIQDRVVQIQQNSGPSVFYRHGHGNFSSFIASATGPICIPLEDLTSTLSSLRRSFGKASIMLSRFSKLNPTSPAPAAISLPKGP